VLVADLVVPVQVVRRAAQAARQRGFPVVLDPSPAARMTDDLYPLAGCLTPNPPETHTLTGIAVHDMDGALQAGAELVKRGVGTAFVKLGDGGCSVVTRDGGTRVVAPPVRVVDKTGAGDAFAGALGVAMLEGRDPAAAGRFAVAAATFAVTGYGSQPAYPARADVERLLPSTQAK
jgi:ribokinase